MTRRTESHASMDAAESAVGGAGQYLSFELGGQEYCIEILRVQEIKGLSKITPIPGMPSHILGVMNLRGTVAPVIDLRRKFGLEDSESSRSSVIVLVALGEKAAGLVVDSVSDVLTIPAGNLKAPPDLTSVDTRFLRGIATIGDRMVASLDIDALLATDLAVAPFGLANN